MSKRIAVAVALLVIAGAGVAVAHGKRATPEQRVERLVARVTRELALDAGQKEQLGKLVAEFQPVVQQLHTSREATREKLGIQLEAGEVDTEALKSAMHDNLGALQKSADLFIERLAAFHATLTPAQKTKVAEKFEKLADWRDGEGCMDGGKHGRSHDRKRDRK